jgi:hypothetical protein
VCISTRIFERSLTISSAVIAAAVGPSWHGGERMPAPLPPQTDRVYILKDHLSPGRQVLLLKVIEGSWRSVLEFDREAKHYVYE